MRFKKVVIRLEWWQSVDLKFKMLEATKTNDAMLNKRKTFPSWTQIFPLVLYTDRLYRFQANKRSFFKGDQVGAVGLGAFRENR